MTMKHQLNQNILIKIKNLQDRYESEILELQNSMHRDIRLIIEGYICGMGLPNDKKVELINDTLIFIDDINLPGASGGDS